MREVLEVDCWGIDLFLCCGELVKDICMICEYL